MTQNAAVKYLPKRGGGHKGEGWPLTIHLDDADVKRLDAKILKLQKEHPKLRVTRTGVCRMMIKQALENE